MVTSGLIKDLSRLEIRDCARSQERGRMLGRELRAPRDSMAEMNCLTISIPAGSSGDVKDSRRVEQPRMMF